MAQAARGGGGGGGVRRVRAHHPVFSHLSEIFRFCRFVGIFCISGLLPFFSFLCHSKWNSLKLPYKTAVSEKLHIFRQISLFFEEISDKIEKF